MRTILYFIAILILATSCEDWLDIKPKGKIIPEKAEDYELLMEQALDRGASYGWVKTYGNDLFISDNVAVSDGVFQNYLNENARNAYTWAEHIYLETEEDPDWKIMYNQIYVANIVINEVMSSSGDEALKKQLYAEAKVQRAYSYWVLVNLYAKQYNPSTASTDLGVPLITKPIIEGSLVRASVKEVYDLILNDLNESVNVLPNRSKKNYRVSNASAYALLSRVYLYMGSYEMALDNATKSLNLYNFLYNYNSLPKNEWYPAMLDFPKSYLNDEQLLNKEPNNSFTLFYPSPSLLGEYDLANDLRYTGMYDVEWFEPFTDKLYLQEYLTGRTYGLSVSEVLLNQAECFARSGNITDAIAKVNYIRERRITTAAYVPVTATTKEEALVLVKKERRIELAFKGLRWFDLKRYNAYDNANISITRTVNGKVYTLAPNDNRWVLPIGRKYILKNPELVQNPR